ncbi:phosphoglycolate phosphatase [Seohaeicola zhoushanensis]|uniref:Phosphoglycolate phosphatase n=1 Tax=Seohaeicola zhoushanensis TaxID=1569283 RepID=A0A8J3GX85_9RHOB|nr:phosphoglycolate phosphatase [Seohaeicola zhoushanensis]GHF52571.1 phosphoglycolate phosphatase [Seohaeicola zhoushanensis]
MNFTLQSTQRVKGLVFDLDGTLIDSARDIMTAANRLLADHSAEPIDLEQTIRFIGHGIPTLVRRVLDHRGIGHDEAILAEQVRIFSGYYGPAATETTHPYPGVMEMLAQLAAREFGLAICTNKAEAATKLICDTLGLTPYFPVIIGGDTLAVRKPDPAPLLLAIERLGVAVDECLYVGDSETDYATARNAGVRFAYFEGGYQRRDIADFAPDYRLAATSEITGLV